MILYSIRDNVVVKLIHTLINPIYDTKLHEIKKIKQYIMTASNHYRSTRCEYGFKIAIIHT